MLAYLSPILRRNADLVFSMATSSIGQFPEPSNYTKYTNLAFSNIRKNESQKNVQSADHAWIMTSRGCIQEDVSFCNLRLTLFSTARGCGRGGKTDVNLNAVTGGKYQAFSQQT